MEAQPDMILDDGSEGSTDNDDFCILEAPGMGIPVSAQLLLLLLVFMSAFLSEALPACETLAAQRRRARGDRAVRGSHQGEGQPLFQASRKFRPAASSERIPSAAHQGGAEGNLCGVASLRRQGLRWQADVHTCSELKQVFKIYLRFVYCRVRFCAVSQTVSLLGVALSLWVFVVLRLAPSPLPVLRTPGAGLEAAAVSTHCWWRSNSPRWSFE